MFRITLLPRAIRRELLRLDASEPTLQNLGYGLAVLRRDIGGTFSWQGRAHEILERLRARPDGTGADAVVSAFPPRE